MSAQHTPKPVRPSRTYKDGIGKPVVKKVWDDAAQAHRWDVVFPPCNSFGEWIVEPEAKLVHKAWQWCFNMNGRLIDAERAARALAKVTGSAEGRCCCGATVGICNCRVHAATGSAA